MSTATFTAAPTPVTFKEDGKTFQGDLYVPKNAKGPLPLVVVVHGWWGKSKHAIAQAMRIANEVGYAALASPFYKDPLMGVDRIQKFIAAAPKNSVDVSKVVSIGYCFGGTQSLNLARSGNMPDDAKLLGVVSFHGGLSSSLKPHEPIEAKILVLHGAADKLVTDQDVMAFREEMRTAHADLTFIAYPGALHAFTDPDASRVGKEFNIAIAYDAKADEDSWQQLREFLKKTLGTSV